MKLKYTPYRGKIEPITKVYKSDIELTDKFIEITTYYDYEAFNSETLVKKPDICKAIDFIPKEKICNISLEYIVHEGDKEEEIYPRVKIDSGLYSVWVNVNNEEGYKLYTTIKNWYLNEVSTS